jgi:hypothetical protein
MDHTTVYLARQSPEIQIIAIRSTIDSLSESDALIRNVVISYSERHLYIG